MATTPQTYMNLTGMLGISMEIEIVAWCCWIERILFLCYMPYRNKKRIQPWNPYSGCNKPITIAFRIAMDVLSNLIHSLYPHAHTIRRHARSLHRMIS